MPENAISFLKVTQHWVRVTKGHGPLGAEYNMDSQSKEAQGQGVKKLAKQHLTKKQGVEGGQALRRAQHLTNPSDTTRFENFDKESESVRVGVR